MTFVASIYTCIGWTSTNVGVVSMTGSNLQIPVYCIDSFNVGGIVYA